MWPHAGIHSNCTPVLKIKEQPPLRCTFDVLYMHMTSVGCAECKCKKRRSKDKLKSINQQYTLRNTDKEKTINSTARAHPHYYVFLLKPACCPHYSIVFECLKAWKRRSPRFTWKTPGEHCSMDRRRPRQLETISQSPTFAPWFSSVTTLPATCCWH